VAKKRAEKRKKSKKTAGKADPTETMVAALAHEIKNPLNSMMGASQYIYNKYSNKKDIKEFIKIIIDEIERLDRYLNEFLSFSRGITLNLKESDIINFLTGVIMLTKHSFPCEIKIIKLKEDIPVVYIDHEKVVQVMINLLSNSKDAVKETPSPSVDILVDYNKNFLYITVRDNGHGIDSSDIKKVFDPFFTNKNEGIGIGLTVCKSIVKKHGGKITASSIKGKGSEFKFSISRKAVAKRHA